MKHERLKERLYLSPPHLSGNEEKYLRETLESNWIAPLGPQVDNFEKLLSEYCGKSDALALSSGTAALHLCLRHLKIKSGDVVLCSTLTFAGGANPVLYEGGTIEWVDSDLDSWCMSPKALLSAIDLNDRKGTRIRAVIVANIYGQSAKYKEIKEILSGRDIVLIEDAAESLGAEYEGKKSGFFGDFVVLSFNGNKIITTSGGGMLLSNDSDAIKHCRFLSTQARDPALHYEHSELGFNYRLSNLLAAVGRAQFEVLESRVASRRGNFDLYQKLLDGVPGLSFMPELPNSKANRWLTMCRFDKSVTGIDPIKLVTELEKLNIESRRAWKPMHCQPLFKGSKLHIEPGNRVFSEEIFENAVCLPSGSNMNPEKIQFVTSAIRELLNN